MLLGNILMVPVGNAVIYVRPLYVESSGNPQPELTDVITVLGQNVQIQTDGAAVPGRSCSRSPFADRHGRFVVLVVQPGLGDRRRR